MTTRRRLIAAGAGGLGALTLGAAALAQTASGSYDLSWRALVGGGKSDGGGYVAQTAIGQPLAQTSTGGSYSVSSGFLGGGQDKYRRFLPFLSRDGSN
ncbi:MAG: hypothetical protein ABI577_05220 [bacterium]